ncbi:MAG: hypothetical protein U0610_23885 [bacterium]
MTAEVDVRNPSPQTSFSFLLNVRSLPAERVVVAPGHELRRATPTEVARIRTCLDKLTVAAFVQNRLFWEEQWPRPDGDVRILPEAEWRYFVIAYDGTNTTMAVLEVAFDLLPSELEVGFSILNARGAGGIVWNGPRLFHVLDNGIRDPSFCIDVTTSDVDLLARFYPHLCEADEARAHIRRQAARLGHLKCLPHDSPLRFLGYFAILEGLLTHNPKPGDPHDSITRQVNSKVALLNNRWQSKLDYSAFGGAMPATIWKKMYAYRSEVAHGGEPQFKGELACLGSATSALNLLKATVKSVLRYGLEDPQLLRDLRSC